jgi:hypothetical protein
MVKRLIALLFVLGMTVVSTFLTFPFSASAVSLQIDSTGQLLGATGVDVSGTLYDVEFVQGRCYEVFDGCDDAFDDFVFQSSTAAAEAASALLSQVLLDGPEGLFDTEPDLVVYGAGFDQAAFFTPYSINAVIPGDPEWTFVYGSTAANLPNAGTVDNDYIQTGLVAAQNSLVDGDETLGVAYLWADWTPVKPVPEPSTLLLLGSGLAGLVGFRRKFK